MVEPTNGNRCNGKDGYSAGLVCMELCMSTRVPSGEASWLIERLIKEHGNKRRAARAFTDRHGGKLTSAERRFHRVQGGQARVSSEFMDELEVMF
jgi:hypothetical protein